MSCISQNRVRAISSVAVVMFVLASGRAAFAQDCPADVNGDSAVDVTDLLAVLTAWGPCPNPCPPCAEDVDGDCQVSVTDLLDVLTAWGPCPCDPSGTWQIDGAAMTYTCVFGLVDINVTSFTFSQNQTTLSVVGAPAFTLFTPVTMTGPAVNCGFGETFVVSQTIPGSCTETYRLEGTFLGEDQFVATLHIEFEGGKANCFDCVNQEFTASFNRE